MLNPQKQKWAEMKLKEMEINPKYVLALTECIENTINSGLDAALIQILCILVKNYIFAYWPLDNMTEQEREFVRQKLLHWSLTASAIYSRVLEESVVKIASNDYPELWPSFVADVKVYIKGNYSPEVIKNCFHVLEKCFQRFIFEEKSDTLIIQIINIVNEMGPLILENIEQISGLICEASTDDGLAKNLDAFAAILGFYNTLIGHDIPEYFESNACRLFDSMRIVIRADILSKNVGSVALKSYDNALVSIGKLLVVYSSKYLDDVPNIVFFVEASLSLLSQSRNKPFEFKNFYVRFLSDSIRENSLRSNLESSLDLILENVILPSISWTVEDYEHLDDEPIDFVRKDLEFIEDENSTVCSVRKFCMSLVEIFGSHFLQKCRSFIINHDMSAISQSLSIRLLSCIVSNNSETEKVFVRG